MAAQMIYSKKVRNIAWAIQATRKDLVSATPRHLRDASKELLDIFEAIAIVWVYEPMTGNDGLKSHDAHL